MKILIFFLLLLVGCSDQPKQYDRELVYRHNIYYQLMGWDIEKPRKVVYCAFGGENEEEAYYCALKNFGEEGINFLQERKNYCEICSRQRLFTLPELKNCAEICRP